MVSLKQSGEHWKCMYGIALLATKVIGTIQSRQPTDAADLSTAEGFQ
jgi:hypothetical protein